MLNIYKLYDNKENLLYIGKTKNINRRISQHMGERNKIAWKGSVSKIEIADVDSEIDMEIYETYLINKLSPMYNEAKKYEDKSSIKLKELEFYEYSKSKGIKHFLSYDDKIVGFCYKIFLSNGFSKFKSLSIMKDLGYTKTRFYELINKCVELKLIEKMDCHYYKLSNDFILGI